MALASMRCLHHIIHQNGHGTPASYPNKLIKYQKSCIFKECSKSAKSCKKCQKGPKGSKKCQKLLKRARKCQNRQLYLCLPFSSQSSNHHHSQTVRARELKFVEDVHHPPRVTCHMSRDTCHLSFVRCRMSLPNRKS